jgi:hypothetical protein
VTAALSTDGADAANYTANTLATDTASIFPIALEIGIAATSKDYDRNTDAETSAHVAGGLLAGDEVSVSSTRGYFATQNAGTGIMVTAALSTDGADAANYTANLTATDTASIYPIGLEIGITANNKYYDGDSTAITSAHVAGGLLAGDFVSVSSADGYFATENAGTGIMVTAALSTDGADAGNYTANATATTIADIIQLELSVTPVDAFLYIREGDPLPEFAFNYLGWIAGDEGNEGYTVVREDGFTYDAASNESAGTYTITPEPSNSNYRFMLEAGILHVNPYGPGTRAVKPVLNCIEEIGDNLYVANFEYKNENDVAVFIPLGVDNLLTGSGIDWARSQDVPTMFVPGGDSFMVFFDGSALSWTVKSSDGDQKVSNAANANSSSTKCNGNNKKAATVTADIEDENLVSDELQAYPNPVIDKVHLSMKEIENYKMVQLFDFAGRSFPVTSINKRTDHLEIEMAQLPAGHYFIRIVMEDSSRVVQIIKQ